MKNVKNRNSKSEEEITEFKAIQEFTEELEPKEENLSITDKQENTENNAEIPLNDENENSEIIENASSENEENSNDITEADKENKNNNNEDID